MTTDGTPSLVRRLDGAVERIVRFSFRRNRLVLALTLLALVAAGWAATGLGVDTDSSRMIDERLAFQERNQDFEAAFPELDAAIVVVARSANADAADAVLRDIAGALEGDATVASTYLAEGDPFLRGHGPLYLEPQDLAQRMEALARAAPILSAVRADPSLATLFTVLAGAEAQAASGLEALYEQLARSISGSLEGRPDPLQWSRLGTPSESDSKMVLRLLQVVPVPDFTSLQPVEGTIEAIGAAIDGGDPALSALVEIGVTGDPALRHEELESVSRGIGLSLGVSFLVVAVLLVFAYRSLARTVVTLGGLVVSLVLATGFAAVAFPALNLVSVAFVVLLVGLGLDFTIHAFLHVEPVPPGADPMVLERGVGAIGATIGGALTLSALTTALAFLAFVPTDFTGIAQLGVLGAAGVAIAFLVAITLVPALVASFPRLAVGVPRETVSSQEGPRRSLAPLAWLLPVLVAGAAWLAQDVRFDADPSVLRDPSSPSMRALAWLHEDEATAPYRLSVLLRDRAEATRVAREVERLDNVRTARVLDDFVPEDQGAKLAILDAVRPTLRSIATGSPVPRANEPAALLLSRLGPDPSGARAELVQAVADWRAADPAARARAEADAFRFLAPLTETLALQAEASTVTDADLPDAIVQRFRAETPAGPLWRVDVAPVADLRDPAAAAAFVRDVETAVAAAPVGPPVFITQAGQAVSRSILQAVAVAAALTLAVCLLVVRDVRLVAAIVIPLVSAGIFTAAASAWFGIAFNYANVIVLPLIVGLGVDSGIHIALRRRAATSTAALYATNTPRAVLFSGLTTVAAFASLGLSDHRGTASMGQMLALAVVLTLATTLIWTPALCDLFERRARR